MKKTFFTIVFAIVMCNSASAFSIEDVLLWLPNRLIDLTDIVSFGVGSHFGAPKVGIRVTRAIDFNAGDAAYCVFRKDYNRWFGCSLEQGHSASFLYMGTENYRVDRVWGIDRWWYPTDDSKVVLRGQNMLYQYNWWEHPTQGVYDIKTGTRDWFEISAEFGCLVYTRVAIHPIEIVDFILGIFFIDIKDDDLTSDDEPDEYFGVAPGVPVLPAMR